MTVVTRASLRRLASTALGIASLALAIPAAAERPDLPDVMLQRAKGKHALALYEEAASGYESFAALYPAQGEAAAMLKEAIVLRIGMGNTEAAQRDIALFARLFGAKQPSESASLVVALAQFHLDHQDPTAAKKLLEASMALLDRAAPLDKRIVAHALFSRAAQKLGDRKRAEAELGVVRALWKDPAAVVKTLGEQGADNRRLGLALTALGEAHFFFAEQKRAEAEALQFPAYTGKGDRDDVLKHVNTKVVDWIRHKRPLIEAAEKEYQKVLQIQPVPPPRWVIASAARVGQMWSRFVSDFRSAPIPKAWMANGPIPDSTMTYEALRRDYFKAIDDSAEPVKQTAKGAFKTCLNYSVKFQYFDSHAESCAAWLTRYYKDEYPRIDELTPRSGLLDAPGLSSALLPDPRGAIAR